MSNNSSIDLLSKNLEADFPSLKDAPYDDVILETGDMLFIPRWHWHYCTAVMNEDVSRTIEAASHAKANHVNLDVCNCFSWSVNFWWGKRLLKN